MQKLATLGITQANQTATVKNSLPDLANAVDVELGDLLETGNNFIPFAIDDTKANKELNDFVQKFSDKTAGLNMIHGASDNTYRIIVDTDKNSAEGLKKELDILNSLRNELFDYYGAENVQDIGLYNDLTDRITSLTKAYDEYSDSLRNYNDTAAQAQIIQSLTMPVKTGSKTLLTKRLRITRNSPITLLKNMLMVTETS